MMFLNVVFKTEGDYKREDRAQAHAAMIQIELTAWAVFKVFFVSHRDGELDLVASAKQVREVGCRSKQTCCFVRVSLFIGNTG